MLYSSNHILSHHILVGPAKYYMILPCMQKAYGSLITNNHYLNTKICQVIRNKTLLPFFVLVVQTQCEHSRVADDYSRAIKRTRRSVQKLVTLDILPRSGDGFSAILGSSRKLQGEIPRACKHSPFIHTLQYFC